MKNKKQILIFILIIISLFSLLVFYLNIFKNTNKVESKIINLSQKEESNINNLKIIKKNVSLNEEKDAVGRLTINSIGIINQNVIDGISDTNLSLNICHFQNTPIFNGNVCLAAHNYSIETSDLFKNLKDVNIGDLVIYENEIEKRKYKVYMIEKILDTDLSVLENTKENIVTMITCVNDRKDMRLCVKALEVKEEL